MSPFIAEILGTAILILLGNGAVANVVLRKTKGEASGWIVITVGWGMAVFTAVFCVAQYSGAHINPAVTIGLAAAGVFSWANVPVYLAAQMIGAFIGAVLVFLFYRNHYAVTDDPAAKLATFSTIPAIRSFGSNFLSEAVGTFILVFGCLLMVEPSATMEGGSTATIGLGAMGALPVGLLVFAIGLSLGGTTGYAINPARDLGPRLAHAILPISDKGNSDWRYSWIPVFGPITGSVLAAALYLAVT